MSAVRRITRNAVLLNIARIISTLGKFFLFIFIAKRTRTGSTGAVFLRNCFTSFFAIVISPGMDDLLVREIARDNTLAGKYLGNMFLIRMALSVVIFCIIVITAMIIGYPSSTQSVFSSLPHIPVFTSFSFCSGLPSAHLKRWNGMLCWK